MFLNKKGAEGMWWTIAGAGIALLILIILILAFLSEGGIWGKTKVAVTKFFDIGEKGIKLYKEYLMDNPSKEVIRAGLIRDFIITNLSKIENKDCIGYLDLSGINEDISDYSVYFKKNNDKTEFYVYNGDYDKYEEVLKNNLAFGSLNLIIFSKEFLGQKDFYEFEASKGFKEIYSPDGGASQRILIKDNHPYFLRYKDKGIRFLLWNEEDKISANINKC